MVFSRAISSTWVDNRIRKLAAGCHRLIMMLSTAAWSKQIWIIADIKLEKVYRSSRTCS